MKLISIYDSENIFVDKNDIRGQWIIEQKGTQKEKVSLLRNLCIKAGVKNFYDLGANYGEFSAYLSKHVERVFSFEPNPFVFQCLSRTSELYPNMSVFQNAVATKDEDRFFHFNTKYSGGGQLNEWAWKDSRYSNYNKKEYYKMKKVKCINFSNFFKNTNESSPTLLKIDIEGMELEIIQSLKEALEPLSSWFIYFESDKMKTIPDGLPGTVLKKQASDTLIGKIKL